MFSFSVSSKLTELKRKLRETGTIISGEKSILPIDKNIQRVELQISKSRWNAQDESDYQKLNKDPKMWSKSRHGNIALEELFEEAYKIARKNAALYTNNKNAQARYITVQGNCVAVSGQAGLGKTTLTKQFVDKVLEETVCEIDFLFYISLRKVKFDKEIDVLHFLLTNLHSGWEHDVAVNKAILKELAKSEKVMIIIDGLDEADINFEDSCPTASITDVTTPETILKNLLDGHMLPNAKKLITSRPRQLLELRECYRPDFIVNILGIDSDAQQQICRDICGSDCDRVYLYVTQHPELSAQCFVPLICIFTIYSLHQQQLNPDDSISFGSMTSIILYVLENFHRLRVLRNGTLELDKLSKLAWEGLRHKKYEFSDADLHRMNLKKESLDTVLTTGTNDSTKLRIAHCGKITYFSHLILQEFFSAAYLILFAPFQEFKKALSLENDQTNLDVVKKFLFGLSNPDACKRLRVLHKVSNITIDLEQKNKYLFLNVSKLRTKVPFFKRVVSTLPFSTISSIDFSSYQSLCSWVYESQQKNLTEHVAQFTSKHLQISGNIFPHEVFCLCYVLRSRLKPLILNFKQPKFVGDSCERLLKEISAMQNNITVSNNMQYVKCFVCAEPDKRMIVRYVDMLPISCT